MAKRSARNFEKNPYSQDEARVACFFFERGLGGGDDPIGALLASVEYQSELHKKAYQEVLELRSQLAQATRAST